MSANQHLTAAQLSNVQGSVQGVAVPHPTTENSNTAANQLPAAAGTAVDAVVANKTAAEKKNSDQKALFNELLEAIKKENIDHIQSLVNASEGAILVEHTDDARTPHFFAGSYGFLKSEAILRTLEEKYFPAAVYNVKTWDELTFCSMTEFKERIKKDSINPNYRNQKIRPLLFQICLPGIPSQEKLLFLLEHAGGNINLQRNNDYYSGIFSDFIANEGRAASIELLKFVLQRNEKIRLNPNMVDSNQRTCLMLAIAVGQLDEFIELFLNSGQELGLNLDLQDKDGFTHLHMACIVRDLKTISRLISLGASLTIKDKKGRNPLELLDEKHNSEYKALMDSVDINIARDKAATLNSIRTTMSTPNGEFKDGYKIFSKDNVENMAKKFLKNRGNILDDLEHLGAHMQKNRSMFSVFKDYYVLANKDAARYGWNQLFCYMENPGFLAPLSMPAVKKQKKEVEATLNSFSGITLEQYTLDPARTAAARRIFAPAILPKLQMPRQLPQVRTMLLQFQNFQGRGVKSNSNKNGNTNETIADLICDYLNTPVNINQIIKEVESSKSKQKRDRKKKADKKSGN